MGQEKSYSDFQTNMNEIVIKQLILLQTWVA